MADEKRGNKVSDERQGTLGEERTMRDFPKLPNHPRFREIPREGGQLHYGYTTKQFLCDGGQWSDLNDLTARQRESAAAIAIEWFRTHNPAEESFPHEKDWRAWGWPSKTLPREEEVAAAAVCGCVREPGVYGGLRIANGVPTCNICNRPISSKGKPPEPCAECARLRARLAAMTILAEGGK